MKPQFVVGVIIGVLFIMFAGGRALYKIARQEGQSQICEQVCPTTLYRIENNICECVIEEVSSPKKLTFSKYKNQIS